MIKSKNIVNSINFIISNKYDCNIFVHHRIGLSDLLPQNSINNHNEINKFIFMDSVNQ